MTVEDRLRRALHDDASDGDVDELAWSRIQSGVRARRQARATRVAVLSAAAVIAVAVGVGSQLVDDGDRTVVVGPTDSSTPSTATTATTGVPEPERVSPGIWPFHTEGEADAYARDPGMGMFFDAQATALEFAREYLGMHDPVVAGEVVEDEQYRVAFVPISPKDGSPLVTTVELSMAGRGAWYVTGAGTPNIEVTEPEGGALVDDSVHVAGESTAFEATVQVEVRDDDGAVLAQTFVMGGANGDMAPFDDDISIEPPTAGAGAVIFTTESMEDGGLQEASVVRIGFADAPTRTVSLFFHRDDEIVEIRRDVQRTDGVLRATLDALFEGPQPDDGGGLSSWFGDATADNLLDVNLRDGTAIVDLSSDGMENASTSAGSRMLLEQLDSTIFQFETIERIEYRLSGSCDAFWQWLQHGDCRLVERD